MRGLLGDLADGLQCSRLTFSFCCSRKCSQWPAQLATDVHAAAESLALSSKSVWQSPKKKATACLAEQSRVLLNAALRQVWRQAMQAGMRLLKDIYRVQKQQDCG